MPEAKEKKCSKCKTKKPAAEFHKDKKTRDGLGYYCKQCVGATNRFYRNMQKQRQTKRCSKCGIKKPIEDFSKSKSGSDGLRSDCKKCHSDYVNFREKLKRPGNAENKKVGISTWSQVGSMLREMAELQFAINAENTLCEKRIAMIRKHSEEAIEPSQTHQIALQVMLEDFLKKNCAKAKMTIKNFRFGGVRFCRGKTEVSLNVELAGKKLDKP